MDILKRIVNAISNTKDFLGTYWTSTLNQRSFYETMAAGSVYMLTSSTIEKLLLLANWEPYSHPAIMPGCTAFKTTDIPEGHLGIIEIDKLSEHTPIILDDRKNTGHVNCTVKDVMGEKTSETIIILGMEGENEVVFTFHPGAPIKPSVLTCEIGMHGKVITTGEAKKLGFDYAKIVK